MYSEELANFLRMPIPSNQAEEMCKKYNITLKPGDTYQTALYAALLREVKEGKPGAKEMAEKYNIYE